MDDPVYLEEPMVRSNNFSLRDQTSTSGPAIPFETVDELGDKPRGWVPHWPIGTKHDEFANRFGLPFEATRGGKATLYPSTRPPSRRCGRAAPSQRVGSWARRPAAR